jgi:hypothetical protein
MATAMSLSPGEGDQTWENEPDLAAFARMLKAHIQLIEETEKWLNDTVQPKHSPPGRRFERLAVSRFAAKLEDLKMRITNALTTQEWVAPDQGSDSWESVIELTNSDDPTDKDIAVIVGQSLIWA